VLYGPVYGDQTLYYKLEMVKRVSPEVLALGNSKILTMRTGFFKEGVTFYNTGGSIPDIASFRKFMQLSGVTPKYIIMTVEPLHFDPLVLVSTSSLYQPPVQTSFLKRLSSTISRSWPIVYKDYFMGKFTVKELLNKNQEVETVGLNARVNNTGFRNDGSLHYGKPYKLDAARDAKINKAILFIDTKSNIKSEHDFSEPALAELDTFLKYCKERNIIVVGYIPPTPQVVEDAYKRHSSYDFIFKTYTKTKPIFDTYGFKVFDTFSLSRIGATDLQAIDEYHTNEKAMVLTLLTMSGKGSPLSSVISQEKLKAILESGKDENDILK
jgi:hypothetical protein